MKLKSFTVPIYELTVNFILSNGRDSKKIKEKLESIYGKCKDVKYVYETIKDKGIDGGVCLTDDSKLIATVIIFKCSSDEKKINTICHEMRHVEEFIVRICGIKCEEAKAYLSGYLGEQMLPQRG